MKRIAIILAALALTGCKTVEYRTINTACASFKPISFAQLPKGKVDDPGNVADSAATVDEIAGHNARWDSTCTALAENLNWKE